ncbi:MAG: hypothetical protein KF685_00830 [Acidobacteria bacterium]|nr:hypothetical protein [Acidobacteriota bacterium]
MIDPVAVKQGNDLKQAIAYGSAASFGLISSALAWMYTNSQYQHIPQVTDTVNEMMTYAEIIAFAVISYFAAALMVWKFGKKIMSSIPTWILISLLGAQLFTFSFFFRVWIVSIPAKSHSNIFLDETFSFLEILQSAFICGAILSVPALVCSLVMFRFITERKESM